MPEATLVIRGGTVVGARGRRARSTSPSAGDRRRRWPSPIDPPSGATVLDAVGLPGRPGPGRPAHPPAPARPRGGGDGRERAPAPPRSGGTPRWWPCPTPSRRSTRPAWPARCSPSAGRCLAEVAVAGAITVGPGRRRAGPHGRAGRPGRDASSPTTAPACRTAR